jgi:hypothetical protein
MRHENNFGEVRLPDGDGLRFQVAITDPQGACECATAWIGEADTILDVINDGIFNDVMTPAGHIKTGPGIDIHEAAQKLLNLVIAARRELALASGVVNGLFPLLPCIDEDAPPLRRAVIDLREKAWERALAELDKANEADARADDGAEGVHFDQAPTKFATMLATPAPTLDTFYDKFEVVVQDIFADSTGDANDRLSALLRDFRALMARRARDKVEAA